MDMTNETREIVKSFDDTVRKINYLSDADLRYECAKLNGQYGRRCNRRDDNGLSMIKFLALKTCCGDKKMNRLTVAMFHTIHKFSHYFKRSSIDSADQLVSYLADIYDHRVVHRQCITPKNQNEICDLKLFNVLAKKARRHGIQLSYESLSVHHTSFEDYSEDIVELLNKFECTRPNAFTLFSVDYVGQEYCPHVTIFLYDHVIGAWIRFEPGSATTEAMEQHRELDNYIKAYKSSYISDNDYHFLPSPQTIYPGLCCTYCSAMFIEKYLELRCGTWSHVNGNDVLLDTIERIIDRDYVERKMAEYDWALSR